ncbi:MAG TPA: 3-hydroxybutyryl-CoA dehydrogenase [Solirubrobacteraceae bacterium]|jgi:3-hydroxybutyryl-CoA dehydrogenase
MDGNVVGAKGGVMFEPVEVGVLGGGFMGGGIAESVARAGHQVHLYEPIGDARAASQQRLQRSVAKAVAAGKLSSEDGEQLRERVLYVESAEQLAGCALVIEAIVEDLEAKLDWFRRLDRIVSESTLLASNTSSIPIAGLAAAVSRPERVLGLHFFSPVPVMKLVEIVSALDTSEASIDFAKRFVESLRKQPIQTKDRSGFIVNMLLVPYLMAAVRMYEQGFANREDIDSGMTLGCGHPMGPLTLCDFIGLDVLYAVCQSLYEEFKQAEYAPPPLMKRMLAAGRLGRKSGRGFYLYSGNAPQTGGKQASQAPLLAG